MPISDSTSRRRLLLLGWAGADWRIIQPLLDAGRMPRLLSLINAGVMGNLLTIPPIFPPALWASIATGRRADTHGILGQVMPIEESFGVRPVMSVDLQASPLWQIINSAGRLAAAVGWPITHPATVFDGLVISDAFADARGKNFDNWPLRKHSVSNPEMQEIMAELRLHPSEVTVKQVLPFIPQAKRIDQETDDRLPLLVASLARAASIHGAGTWIAEHQEWTMLAIHFDIIERLSSAFMQYRPPRMPHVTEVDFEIYRNVVDGAYQFMDMLLGRYLELVGMETHIMLVSDHGFLTDQLRPLPAASPHYNNKSNNYREFGILVLSGPGIKRDDLVFGATLLDVVPTALAVIGLPLSPELEGRVLTQVFEEPPIYENGEKYPSPDFSSRAAQETDDDWFAGRIVELATLGYLLSPANNPAEAAELATIQRLLNLANVHISKREHQKALGLLESLLQLAPEHWEAKLRIAQCHFSLNDTQRCREALDDMAASGFRGAALDYLYGQLNAKEGDSAAAMDYLLRAEEAGLGGRRLLESIGRVHLQCRKWEDAERSFRKALNIDPDFALAHTGLGVALSNQKRHKEAIEHLLMSIGLMYHQPDVHYYLGLSLAAIGRASQAEKALTNALTIQPHFPEAQGALKRVQEALLKQMIEKAKNRNDQGKRSSNEKI